jgi:hypothetical protein
MTQSSPTTVFYSDNTDGTFADALKAVGLAETLYTWLSQLGRDASPVTIQDHGGYYLVTAPGLLDMGAVAQILHPFWPGRGQALVSRGKGADIEADIPKYDYDAQTQRRNDYFAQLNKLAAADRSRYNRDPHADEFAALYALRPDADLDLYIYINHFKVADSYNKLLRQWHGQSIDAFRANLTLLLTIFSQHPNALAPAQRQWQSLVETGVAAPTATDKSGDVTLLQFLNPASGKGGNSPKASALSIGGLSGFWLLEYLKCVGLFTIVAPRMIRKVKDRKTYVLHPAGVDRESLHDVMHRFRAGMLTTNAIALDVLAALRFTRAFVEFRRDALVAQDPSRRDPLELLIGTQPRVTDIAHGFDVVFYKDMGSAYATMNQATINLPAWAPPITAPEQADAFLSLLTEHERVITTIKTTKGDEASEEIELLRRYRDFLSGRDATHFFDFAAHYGDYYLAKRHRNQYAGQFTVAGIEHLENLMTQTNNREKLLHPITQDPGFRAIATAIRQATVTAQYRAAREPGYPFEVRYGLGQDLLRAAAYPHDFMKALGAFIQSFNAENARIDERIAKGSLHSHRRAAVRTEHLDAITQLIDDYNGDSELIGKMLVAYGYARDARTPGEPVPVTPEGDELPIEGNETE